MVVVKWCIYNLSIPQTTDNNNLKIQKPTFYVVNLLNPCRAQSYAYHIRKLSNFKTKNATSTEARNFTFLTKPRLSRLDGWYMSISGPQIVYFRAPHTVPNSVSSESSK